MKELFLKRYTSVLIALSVAYIISFFIVGYKDLNLSSMIWRGDFPGFYGPAWQVFKGDSQYLYNLQYQGDTQIRLFPSLKDHFYIFAYPPFTTLIYAPFLFFEPNIAKLACSLMMFICSLSAFFLLS